MYFNEKDIVQGLMEMNMEIADHRKYKGLEFLKPFQKQVLDGTELSEKQMTQLKRLASTISCYQWNDWNIGWHAVGLK